jgi:predicted metal-dependent hydrolase
MQLPLPLSPPVGDVGPSEASVHPRVTADTSESPVAERSSAGGPWAITFVRRRRARRYVLRVDGEGGVRVTIPRGGSKREAVDFVERHHGWIAHQRRRLPPPGLSLVDRAVWRQKAEAELPVRLLKLALHHGLQVTRVSIRNQRTRWGSCGRNGHITLNWRLILMPDWVAEYVLVHELMHLRRLDHSAAYWILVAAAYPRFREARQWLRLNAERLR